MNMSCFFDHNWGWPRRRGDKDIQTCRSCGAERESKVRFDGPRYHRTQQGERDLASTQLRLGLDSVRAEAPSVTTAAA